MSYGQYDEQGALIDDDGVFRSPGPIDGSPGMDYLEQVRRGIDYIEANLEVDLQSSDVARHAGIGHWHFQRIFKGLTNQTLKTYIRSPRFARSLGKLALDAGFETQASFTRAFSKAFGVTAHYRKHLELWPSCARPILTPNI